MKRFCLSVLAVMLAAFVFGCTTARTDAQLRALDDKSLLMVGSRHYMAGNVNRETAERAIAIFCERRGAAPEVKSDLLRGSYWKGMTKEMAMLSQGRPTHINTDSISGEQWVYRHARAGGQLYLYFRGDELTSWQTTDYVY